MNVTRPVAQGREPPADNRETEVRVLPGRFGIVDRGPGVSGSTPGSYPAGEGSSPSGPMTVSALLLRSSRGEDSASVMRRRRFESLPVPCPLTIRPSAFRGAHDVAAACRHAMADVRVRLPLGTSPKGGNGAWESPGIRLAWDQEIAGSNPAAPTDYYRGYASWFACLPVKEESAGSIPAPGAGECFGDRPIGRPSGPGPDDGGSSLFPEPEDVKTCPIGDVIWRGRPFDSAPRDSRFGPVGNRQTTLAQTERCCGFESHSGHPEKVRSIVALAEQPGVLASLSARRSGVRIPPGALKE